MKFRTTPILLFLLFGCISNSGNKRSVITEQTSLRIDSTLASFVELGRVAGVSALIVEQGEEVYFNAYGDADRLDGTLMDRNTIVQIFSMTKPITGVALMQLYEQGKFELDDPLYQYIPDY